jgi:hypothetical protein
METACVHVSSLACYVRHEMTAQGYLAEHLVMDTKQVWCSPKADVHPYKALAKLDKTHSLPSRSGTEFRESLCRLQVLKEIEQRVVHDSRKL